MLVLMKNLIKGARYAKKGYRPVLDLRDIYKRQWGKQRLDGNDCGQ